MEKIKILQVTDAFYPAIDGVVKVVDNYAKQLNKIAICKVCAPSAPKKSKYVEKGDYTVFRAPSLPAPEGYRMAVPFGTRKLKKQLKAENFDIIHIHSPFTMGKIILKFARKNNIPVVITLHTKYRQDFERKLGKKSPLVNFMMWYILKAYNKADSVWTVSEGAKKVLQGYGYKGNIDVFLNACDYSLPENIEEQKNRLDELHDLKGQKNVFLFVGRMAMYKGLKLLCESLKIVKEKTDDFKMIFVGGGFDKQELIKYSKKLGVFDNCIFTGTLSDPSLIKAYYSRADLLLFPSTFDTSGVVKVEASAHKTPALVIKDSCASDSVIHGENGLLCEENKESLSSVLLEVIDGKYNLDDMGENAYSTIYRSWSGEAKNILAKYEQVIKEYKEKQLKK